MASNLNPYEATPPYTPGSDDFRGHLLANINGKKPANDTYPDADVLNNNTRVAVSLAAVAFVARLEVAFVAGVPTLVSVESTNGAVTVASSTFTLIDLGNGDTAVEYSSSTPVFPTAKGAPQAAICEDVEIDRVRAYFDPGSATAGKFRIHVKTKLGAVGTDARFQLSIP